MSGSQTGINEGTSVPAHEVPIAADGRPDAVVQAVNTHGYGVTEAGGTVVRADVSSMPDVRSP